MNSSFNVLRSQLDDMSSGSGEWINVQAPVRLALVALIHASIAPSHVSNHTSSTKSTDDNVWKEITSIREDLATRATRVEVAESIRLKADRSSIHHLRSVLDGKHAELLQHQLQEQRDVHFAKHDNQLRSELSTVNTRVQQLTDQFASVQFDVRLESMESQMIEYRKRRRKTSDKLSRLVADVRANSSSQAETASLFLTGVARLRETLENVKVTIDHKADGSEVRKMVASKADASDLEALEHLMSSKSVGERFSAVEQRMTIVETSARENRTEQEDSMRTVKDVTGTVARVQAAVDKEVTRIKTDVDAMQVEMDKIRHDGLTSQSHTDRSQKSLATRLVQVEESLDRQKPKMHDLGREIAREKHASETNHDKLESLAKAHRIMETSKLTPLQRDVERLKKTMVSVERQHADKKGKCKNIRL